MRATRGLLASFGAGLSLIVAGTVALTLCSALIAYKGWPGVRVQRTADERALVAAVGVDPAAEPAPASLRLPATHTARHHSSPHRAAFSGAHRTRSAGTALALAPSRGAAASAGAAPAPKPQPGDDPGRAKASAKKLTVPAAGQTVAHVGTTLGDVVARTGTTVGELVEPLAPKAVATVIGTTDATADAVVAVTDAVGRAVDGLVKP